MGLTTRTLYDKDYAEWTVRTAELLREGRLDELDLENLAEEIETLGRSERSAVRSQLRRMLTHLVKLSIQPERGGASWRGSVANARTALLDLMEESPSLRRLAQGNLQKIYREAVELALIETDLKGSALEAGIPKNCPYSLASLLEGSLDALWPRVGRGELEQE
jgi:hypothetical protein